MKKINLRKISSLSIKECVRGIGNKANSLIRLPRILFIEYSHVVDMLAVLLLLVLASYLVFNLLTYNPDKNQYRESKQELNIQLLQRIDAIIKGREEEKDRQLNLPKNKLYQYNDHEK